MLLLICLWTKKLSLKAVGLKIIWQTFDESISKCLLHETLGITPKLGRTLKIEAMHIWEISLTKQGSSRGSLYGSITIIWKNSNYIKPMTSIINFVKSPQKEAWWSRKSWTSLNTCCSISMHEHRSHLVINFNSYNFF